MDGTFTVDCRFTDNAATCDHVTPFFKSGKDIELACPLSLLPVLFYLAAGGLTFVPELAILPDIELACPLSLLPVLFYPAAAGLTFVPELAILPVWIPRP
ncbi:MAG: hypothetical protein GY765_40990 [bacterium]|nr:hypothetical protein [bacterium]